MHECHEIHYSKVENSKYQNYRPSCKTILNFGFDKQGHYRYPFTIEELTHAYSTYMKYMNIKQENKCDIQPLVERKKN